MSADNKLCGVKHLPRAFRDLVILLAVTVILLILSYFFNVFIFLVELFQKHPQAITYIDEIITLLLTLSIGLAVFAWRRWKELKNETAQRLKLQEELLANAITRAETERIINRQLHCQIELIKEEEKKKAGLKAGRK